MKAAACVLGGLCLALAATVPAAAQRARPTPPAVVPKAPPPPPPPSPSPSRARLFEPQDLGLTEGPDRAEWQKPDQIMDALKIADGSIVADIGAAGGWFTIQLARRVGPNGHVYAEDIQPLMLAAINRRVQRENLSNVTTVLGSPTDARLPAAVDVVLMVNLFREMEVPPSDPVMLLRNVGRSLKPRGRIGIVDFLPGDGGPGPAADQRVDPESIITAARAAGLQLVARQAVQPFEYLLIFGNGR